MVTVCLHTLSLLARFSLSALCLYVIVVVLPLSAVFLLLFYPFCFILYEMQLFASKCYSSYWVFRSKCVMM